MRPCYQLNALLIAHSATLLDLIFLLDPGKPGVQSMGQDVRQCMEAIGFIVRFSEIICGIFYSLLSGLEQYFSEFSFLC